MAEGAGGHQSSIPVKETKVVEKMERTEEEDEETEEKELSKVIGHIVINI